MTDAVENLLLEHVKRFQSGQERIETRLEEMTRRLANLEAASASIIQHLGTLAAADASQQLTSDTLAERLGRIERRLELNA